MSWIDDRRTGLRSPDRLARARAMYSAIGERVRERRMGAGVSIEGLAKSCGIHKAGIVKLEDGASVPLLLLVNVAEALDTTLDDLVPLEAT